MTSIKQKETKGNSYKKFYSIRGILYRHSLHDIEKFKKNGFEIAESSYTMSICIEDTAEDATTYKDMLLDSVSNKLARKDLKEKEKKYFEKLKKCIHGKGFDSFVSLKHAIFEGMGLTDGSGELTLAKVGFTMGHQEYNRLFAKCKEKNKSIEEFEKYNLYLKNKVIITVGTIQKQRAFEKWHENKHNYANNVFMPCYYQDADHKFKRDLILDRADTSPLLDRPLRLSTKEVECTFSNSSFCAGDNMGCKNYLTDNPVIYFHCQFANNASYSSVEDEIPNEFSSSYQSKNDYEERNAISNDGYVSNKDFDNIPDSEDVPF